MSDLQIIHKRKTGYTLKEIHEYYISLNPYLDEIVCLTHVARICSENNLPFTPQQVLKVFNKHYSKDAHGDKRTYLKFINGWTSNKLLVFKTEVSKKVGCRPPILEKRGDLNGFSQINELGCPEMPGTLKTGLNSEVSLK
jgi:hypothetical protein